MVRQPEGGPGRKGQDAKGVECVLLFQSIRSVFYQRESLAYLDRLGNQQGCRSGNTNSEPAAVLGTCRPDFGSLAVYECGFKARGGPTAA